MKRLPGILVLLATIIVGGCQSTPNPPAEHECVVTPYDLVECSAVQ